MIEIFFLMILGNKNKILNLSYLNLILGKLTRGHLDIFFK